MDFSDSHLLEKKSGHRDKVSADRERRSLQKYRLILTMNYRSARRIQSFVDRLDMNRENRHTAYMPISVRMEDKRAVAPQ